MLGEGRHRLEIGQRRHGAHARAGACRRRPAAPAARSAGRSRGADRGRSCRTACPRPTATGRRTWRGPSAVSSAAWRRTSARDRPPSGWDPAVRRRDRQDRRGQAAAHRPPATRSQRHSGHPVICAKRRRAPARRRLSMPKKFHLSDSPLRAQCWRAEGGRSHRRRRHREPRGSRMHKLIATALAARRRRAARAAIAGRRCAGQRRHRPDQGAARHRHGRRDLCREPQLRQSLRRLPGRQRAGERLRHGQRPSSTATARRLQELPPVWDGLTAKGVTPPVTQAQTEHLPNAPFAMDDPQGLQRLGSAPSPTTCGTASTRTRCRSTAAGTTSSSPGPMPAADGDGPSRRLEDGDVDDRPALHAGRQFLHGRLRRLVPEPHLAGLRLRRPSIRTPTRARPSPRSRWSSPDGVTPDAGRRTRRNRRWTASRNSSPTAT